MNRKTSPKMLRCFLLAGAALFVLLGATARVSGEVVPRTRNFGASVRVVSSNIRYINAEDDKRGYGWEQRKEVCRDVLLAQDADIICLQESRLGHLDYFERTMPGFARFGIENPGKDGLPGQPINAILYSTARFEKVDSGGFWLSATPDKPGTHFEGSSNRLANWLRLKDKANGREIIVWNTHLHHIGGAVRKQQIAVLLARAAKVSDIIPQVLTGDFNSSAESPVIGSVKSAGWIDSYTFIHGPEDPGLTAHRFLGAKFAATAEGIKRRKIDFVFCNAGFNPIDAEVIRDNREGHYPSDHYFVSAELEYIGSGNPKR